MARLRQKECSLCQRLEPVLFRVQHDHTTAWVFVCRTCWERVSQNNPLYVYGGTWKAKK